MESITDCSLRKLSDLAVDIIMETFSQSRVGHHFSFQNIPADRDSRARNAHLHAIDRRTGVERRRDTDRAFAPDYPDLDRSTVLKNLKFGDNGAFGKIDNVDLVVLLIQVLVLHKADPFDELSQPD